MLLLLGLFSFDCEVEIRLLITKVEVQEVPCLVGEGLGEGRALSIEIEVMREMMDGGRFDFLIP